MQQLWNVRAEITVEPRDFPSGDTVGFMNIITWADSANSARIKIEAYFATFNWHIIRVEESAPIREDFIYDSDEFADMIERAKTNPDAIICGTFHSYKAN
jgi:hypothetical protein